MKISQWSRVVLQIVAVRGNLKNSINMKRKDLGKVSVIVSTYNRPDALRVCLLSLFEQTTLPDEVIIGDDGSVEETALLIEELKAIAPFPIVHVWHEDKGFRLAMMRNKCVARSTGDYIIEIDGDVFLHPEFVADHLREAGHGIYVKGGRVNLGKELTEKICKSGKPHPIHFLTRGIESKRENAVRCVWLARFLAPRYRKRRSAALGCNMSFFREDFIRINGYDEFYEGWGGEDVDLGNRLLNGGCKKRYLKFAGIVYHLWHEDKFMYNKTENFRHMRMMDEQKIVRCEDGVDKYLLNKELI